MAAPGPQRLGPHNGTVALRTYADGPAKKMGHDLVIELERWEATIEHADGGVPAAVAFDADTRSLRVRESVRGPKPLTDEDRGAILKNIGDDVLCGAQVTFRSSTVERDAGRLILDGELTLAGTTRRTRVELDVGEDGRVTGIVPVTQSEWGITPFSTMMGALRVRDTVDVIVDLATAPG
jgi:polyisoprenoid-binding protein YceI